MPVSAALCRRIFHGGASSSQWSIWLLQRGQLTSLSTANHFALQHWQTWYHRRSSVLGSEGVVSLILACRVCHAHLCLSTAVLEKVSLTKRPFTSKDYGPSKSSTILVCRLSSGNLAHRLKNLDALSPRKANHINSRRLSLRGLIKGHSRTNSREYRTQPDIFQTTSSKPGASKFRAMLVLPRLLATPCANLCVLIGILLIIIAR